MSQTGRGLRGRARGCSVALAICAVAALGGAFASTAAAVPGNFWGVAPQETPSAEQFQRLKLGGVDSVRIPIEWNIAQAGPETGYTWAIPDALVGGAAAAGIEVFPFVTGAPTWAVPPVSVNKAVGASAPLHLPVKTAAEKSGWTAFLTEAVRRYGPNGIFWAENPAIPYKPIHVWQLWNEPNFKYFVARPNPAEYGKLVKLSTPIIKSARPERQGGPRRPLRPPQRSRITKPNRRRPTSPPTSSNSSTRRRRGSSRSSTGSRCTPTPTTTRTSPATSKNCAECSRPRTTRTSGSGSPSSAGAPRPRPGAAARGASKRAPGARPGSSKAPSACLKTNQRKWHLKQVFWFSVDDQPGGLQLLRRLRPLRPRLRPQAFLERLREIRGRRRRLEAVVRRKRSGA